MVFGMVLMCKGENLFDVFDVLYVCIVEIEVN